MFFIKLLSFFLCITAHANERPVIKVQGWNHPLHTMKQPDTFLGNDAIRGRLTCPPLTRLHILQKRSQSLIISQTEAISATHWRYTLRRGIYWWDATPVTAEDIKNFIHQQLTKKSGTQQPQLQVTGDAIDVHWQSTPEFGAFFMNGEPFHKPDSEHFLGFQCAGNYQPTDRTWTRLTPSPGYKQPRSDVVFTDPSEKSDLQFTYPSQLSLETENLKQPPVCKHHIPLNAITIIRWNSKSSLLTDTKIRQLLTHALPRKTLAKIGAGGLGQGSLQFIPHRHPAHSKEPSHKSLKKIAEELDQLGYKRSHPDHLRRTPGGETLQLSVHIPTHNILTHVLQSNLHALGIEVSFDQEGRDFRLESLWLSWPDLDISGLISTDFHPAFEQKLKKYRESLTHLHPDFRLLQPLQDYLNDHALMSTVIHHEACLDVQPHIHYGGHLDPFNPDWFRDLIEIANRRS